MIESSTSPFSSAFAAVRAFSVDEAFDALGNRRRRILLARLRERGGRTTVRELTEAIATHERENDDADVDTRAVEISLHHVHVPKLAAAGIVERDGDEVVASDDVDQLSPILAVAE